MGSSEPRILVVSDSPALVIGLTCLPRAWDVVCHPTDVGAATCREAADVLVLDLGSVDAGLALLETFATGGGDPVPVQGEEQPLPVIIVGDDAPADSVPAGATVLLRPYTLPELGEAIQQRLPPSPEQGAESFETPAGTAPEVAQGEVDAPSDDPVIDLTRIPHPPSPTKARSHRWFTRRRPSGDGSGALRDRLAHVLAATAELERIVEEFPLLCSVEGFSGAVVADVASQLEATTVGLWRTGPEGWTVVAHHGLTAQEAGWQVPLDHPLFSEVDVSGGSLLVDPVDALQAVVAGIGGAHTESFMAASIAADRDRFGMLAVGRDRPLTGRDLDTLIDLASEAAPGMAVAEQLARLRALTEEPTPQVVERRPLAWW